MMPWVRWSKLWASESLSISVSGRLNSSVPRIWEMEDWLNCLLSSDPIIQLLAAFRMFQPKVPKILLLAYELRILPISDPFNLSAIYCDVISFSNIMDGSTTSLRWLIFLSTWSIKSTLGYTPKLLFICGNIKWWFLLFFVVFPLSALSSGPFLADEFSIKSSS